MLPPAVRRAVSVAPQSPVISSLAAAAPRAAFVVSSKCNCHQRRYSSSKPSSPDNGSKDLPAGQSVPASAQSKSDDTKSPSEKRKRRVKDSSSSKKLPSVPSTQHLPQEALALSAFFSLHRPISVTHSFPKAVTEDAFASIFKAKTRSQRTSDVISTLSNTVKELEQPMAKLSVGSQQDAEAYSETVTKIDLKHADGSDSAVYLQLNAMSGQFLPFRPPPLPEPESANADAEANAEEAAVEEGPHHRVYKAIFTIEETVDSDGQVKVMAHSPQLIEEQSLPRTFLERMALRQLRLEEGAYRQDRADGMLALSVKRQRKLKMKKKKYKKLMRRTRNLRRKLDRI